MILCEPFTVFQEKKKQSTHNIKERKNRNRVLTMVEKQWWRWNNGGALMRFVLTIEAEHSQHVNAIDFFFFGGGNLEQWWRSSKRRQTERQRLEHQT